MNPHCAALRADFLASQDPVPQWSLVLVSILGWGIPRVGQGEGSQDPLSTQCVPDTLTRALWDPPAGEEVDLAVISGHTKAQVQPDCSLGLPPTALPQPVTPGGQSYTRNHVLRYKLRSRSYIHWELLRAQSKDGSLQVKRVESGFWLHHQ